MSKKTGKKEHKNMPILVTTRNSMTKRTIKEELGPVIGNVVIRLSNTLTEENTATVIREAKENATNELKERAKTLGAHAVLGIRYDTTPLFAHVFEMSCCGTAVIFY
eukprot:TRINITY_DN5694_c0_g1_i1.p1 TRINITY_DN5694_c0_g1~~TRINITY_DN5694_c0_g1_i1.p1  ORF type:complete len:107 (+),score=16.93 TRINITY_DN5694_c0_g1_i1:79-399(+)